MTGVVIAPIVEGHGDVQAIRILIQRLFPDVGVARPIRASRAKILSDEQLSSYAQLCVSNVRECGSAGGIMLLFDSDDDCAVTTAHSRRAKLRDASGLPAECVLAVREFESWLVAGDGQYRYDGEIELKRNPKGVLKEWYGRYRETVDQPGLTAKIDLEQVRLRSRSFRAFDSALVRLMKSIHEQSSVGGEG
ncbi:MAG: DUF4276 family protein [Phycisphaerales bacterium]|nr:DUF4276 family protein [Phycisphaerales bacterium]